MRTSAPSAAQASSFSLDPAVTAVRTPIARAIWIAIVPMPEPPPWTSSHSPCRRRAVITRLLHTVQATSGSDPLSTRLIGAGTDIVCPTATVTRSA